MQETIFIIILKLIVSKKWNGPSSKRVSIIFKIHEQGCKSQFHYVWTMSLNNYLQSANIQTGDAGLISQNLNMHKT